MPTRMHAGPQNIRPDWCRIEARLGDADASGADVYIFDEIGYWGTTARGFAEQIADLDVDQITLHLNSPGGDAWDGVAIANVLRRHSAKIDVIVEGIAASAASLIAMAGEHITMGPSSMMMIHDASGMTWGNAEEMRQSAEILDKLSDSYADAYAKRAGGTTEQWREAMRAETWYTAEEAVLAGLADEWDETIPAVAHSAFRHVQTLRAPRSQVAPRQSPVSPAAAHVPPVSSEPGSPIRKAGHTMSYESLTAGLRERLGITEATASDETILASLDEALTEQTADVNSPAARLPEGVAMIDSEQLASLQAAASEVQQIRAERDTDRRAALVTAAINEGRIPPARRDHWLAQLAADESGMASVLASLPAVVPLAEKGHSDGVDADTEYARYFPTETKES